MDMTFEQYHVAREAERTEEEKASYLDIEAMEAAGKKADEEESKRFMDVLAEDAKKAREKQDRLAYDMLLLQERIEKERVEKMKHEMQREIDEQTARIKAKYQKEFGSKDWNDPLHVAWSDFVKAIGSQSD